MTFDREPDLDNANVGILMMWKSVEAEAAKGRGSRFLLSAVEKTHKL